MRRRRVGARRSRKVAAADRALGAGVADDEAVAGGGGDRAVEHELDEAALAGSDRAVGEQDDARLHLGGAVVQVDREPLGDRARLAGEDAELGVDPGRRRVQPGVDDHVAAGDGVLGHAVAGEVERAAVAGAAALGGAVLRVQAADADGEAVRAGDEVVARRDAAGEHGAGDDGAGALQGEAAVDGEAERGVGRRRRAGVSGDRGEAGAQLVDAGAGGGGDLDDRGVLEAGAEQGVGDAGAGGGDAVRVDEVGLGQGDEAAAEAEEVEDREVLAGLRHHPVVGGDDEEREVDAGGAGEHVADQPLVAGDVDEADDRAVLAPACRRSRGRW